jgi:hypothetical protein
MDTHIRLQNHALVFVTAVTLAGLCLSATPTHAQQRGTVVVVTPQSLVRQEPNAESAVVLTTERNAEFRAVESNADWVKVTFKGGQGWLPRGEVGFKVNRGGQCVEMGVREALAAGAVEGGFFGQGSSTGDSIILRGKSALKLPVCPPMQQVQPGTVLINSNAGNQNMVIRKLRGTLSGQYIRSASTLRFSPTAIVEYLFEAYCMNFTRGNPSQSDQLTPAETAPDAVVKILKVRSSDIVAVQLAIWAVTDNPTAADARSHFRATDKDIAAARQIVQSAGLPVESYRLFS